MQRRQIWLRFQKWGGLPHYHHLVEPLGYDDYGCWLVGTRQA